MWLFIGFVHVFTPEAIQDLIGVAYGDLEEVTKDYIFPWQYGCRFILWTDQSLACLCILSAI